MFICCNMYRVCCCSGQEVSHQRAWQRHWHPYVTLLFGVCHRGPCKDCGNKVQALSGRGHEYQFHNTILKYFLHMYQYLASPQVGTTLPPAPITQPPSSTSSSSQGQARDRLFKRLLLGCPSSPQSEVVESIGSTCFLSSSPMWGSDFTMMS